MNFKRYLGSQTEMSSAFGATDWRRAKKYFLVLVEMGFRGSQRRNLIFKMKVNADF